jgi:hypothetical protein
VVLPKPYSPIARGTTFVQSTSTLAANNHNLM